MRQNHSLKSFLLKIWACSRKLLVCFGSTKFNSLPSQLSYVLSIIHSIRKEILKKWGVICAE